MQPEPDAPRPHCFRCDKPQSACLCDQLTALPNRVGVHVLQHRPELRNPIGTVRLLRLGLAQVGVHVVRFVGSGGEIEPVDLPPGAGVLYPSDDAQDLESLLPHERPAHLVVIDGTWSHAHRIHRDTPWLQALPHYRLTPTRGSRYRIRAEPRRECLSTVEAVVAALERVEPELAGTHGLLTAFDHMIDTHIAARRARHARPGGKGPPRFHRPRAVVATPELTLLREARDRAVVVYAEAAPRGPSWVEQHEPSRLTALTLDGGRAFDAAVAARTPPDAHMRAKLGVGEAWFENARPFEEVRADFVAFCSGGLAGPPVLVAWAPWTHALLRSLVPEAEHLSLKGVWASVHRQRLPGLDRLLELEGLEPTPVPFEGRAAWCVGAAHAVARRVVG